VGWVCRTIKYFSLKPEEQIQLGRHRRIWKDNIKMDLEKKGWEDVGWIQLAQLSGSYEHGNDLRVP
jgi:hypothetical protein